MPTATSTGTPVPTATVVPTATPASGGVTVIIQGYGYQPQQLEIDAGTTVIWHNNDPVQHDTDEKDGIWDSPLLSESETWSRTFLEPGKFLYICSIHPYMQGLVTVR